MGTSRLSDVQNRSLPASDAACTVAVHCIVMRAKVSHFPHSSLFIPCKHASEACLRRRVIGAPCCPQTPSRIQWKQAVTCTSLPSKLKAAHMCLALHVLVCRDENLQIRDTYTELDVNNRIRLLAQNQSNVQSSSEHP